MGSFDLSLAQKVAVAVALPVASFLLYFLLKRSNEEEEEINKQVYTSRQTLIEVQVPRSMAGVIIGSRGSRIKEVQEGTGARIQFKDDQNSNNPERTMVIRGTVEAAQQAEMIIRRIMAEVPPICKDTLNVPVKAIGRIIGRGGETIRMLSRSSKCRIQVPQEQKLGGIQRITLEGTVAAIESAKALIVEKVREDEAMQARIAVIASNRQERGPRRKEPTTHTNHHETMSANAGDNGKGQSDQGNQQRDDGNSKSDQGLSDQGNRKSECNLTAPQAGDQTVEVTPAPAEWSRQRNYLDVYVSAVEHPGHFWVQVISAKATRLDELSQNMTRYYTTLADGQECLVGEVQVGDLLAAPFEHDDLWYRVRVAEVAGDKVDAYYVDFGDSCYLEKTQLRTLRGDFLGLALQAIEVRLANVKPKGGEWSEDAICLFEELTHTAKWKVINARTISYHHTDDGEAIPCLELVDTNGTTDINVAKQLIEKDWAEYTQEMTIDSAATSPDSASMTQIDVSRAAEERKVISPTTLALSKGQDCISLAHTSLRMCRNNDSDTDLKLEATFDGGNTSDPHVNILCDKETGSMLTSDASDHVYVEPFDRCLLKPAFNDDELVIDSDIFYDAKDAIVSDSICVNRNPCVGKGKTGAGRPNDIGQFSDSDVFNPQESTQQMDATSQILDQNYQCSKSNPQSRSGLLEFTSKVLRPTTLTLNVENLEDLSGDQSRFLCTTMQTDLCHVELSVDEELPPVIGGDVANMAVPLVEFSDASKPENVFIGNDMEDTYAQELSNYRQVNSPCVVVDAVLLSSLRCSEGVTSIQEDDLSVTMLGSSKNQNCGMAPSFLESVRNGYDPLHRIGSDEGICTDASAIFFENNYEKCLPDNVSSRKPNEVNPDVPVNVNTCEFSSDVDEHSDCLCEDVFMRPVDVMEDECDLAELDTALVIGKTTSPCTESRRNVNLCYDKDMGTKYREHVMQVEYIVERSVSQDKSPLDLDVVLSEKDVGMAEPSPEQLHRATPIPENIYEYILPADMVTMNMRQARSANDTTEHLESKDGTELLGHPPDNMELQIEGNQCLMVEDNYIDIEVENKGNMKDVQVAENFDLHKDELQRICGRQTADSHAEVIASVGGTFSKSNSSLVEKNSSSKHVSYPAYKSCVMHGMAYVEEVKWKEGTEADQGTNESKPPCNVTSHKNVRCCEAGILSQTDIFNGVESQEMCVVSMTQSLSKYVSVESQNSDEGLSCELCGVPVGLEEDFATTNYMDDRKDTVASGSKPGTEASTIWRRNLPQRCLSNNEPEMPKQVKIWKPNEDISFENLCDRSDKECNITENSLQAHDLILADIHESLQLEEEFVQEIAILNHSIVQGIHEAPCASTNHVEVVHFAVRESVTKSCDSSIGQHLTSEDRILHIREKTDTDAENEPLSNQLGMTEYYSSESEATSEDSVSERTVLSTSFGSEGASVDNTNILPNVITTSEDHRFLSFEGAVTKDPSMTVQEISQRNRIDDLNARSDSSGDIETRKCCIDGDSPNNVNYENEVPTPCDRQMHIVPNTIEVHCQICNDLKVAGKSADAADNVTGAEESRIEDYSKDSFTSEWISGHHNVPQGGSDYVIAEHEIKYHSKAEHTHGLQSTDEEDLSKIGKTNIATENNTTSNCSMALSLEPQSTNKRETEVKCSDNQNHKEHCQFEKVIPNVSKLEESPTLGTQTGESHTHTGGETMDSSQPSRGMIIDTSNHCAVKEWLLVHDSDTTSSLWSEESNSSSCRELIDACKGEECLEIDVPYSLETSTEDELPDAFIFNSADKRRDICESAYQSDDPHIEQLQFNWSGIKSCLSGEGDRNAELVSSCCDEKFTEVLKSCEGTLADAYIKREPSYADASVRRQNSARLVGHLAPKNAPSYRRSYSAGDIESYRWSECSPSGIWSEDESMHVQQDFAWLESLNFCEEEYSSSMEDSLEKTQYCTPGVRHRSPSRGHTSAASGQRHQFTTGETRHCSLYEEFQDMLEEVYGHASIVSMESNTSTSYASAVEDLADSLEDLTAEHIGFRYQDIQCSSPSPSSMSQDSLNDIEDMYSGTAGEEDFCDAASSLRGDSIGDNSGPHVIFGTQLEQTLLDANITPTVEFSQPFHVLTPTGSCVSGMKSDLQLCSESAPSLVDANEIIESCADTKDML